MDIHFVNAEDGPQTSGSYAQACKVTGATQTLYISGQIPVDADGGVPEGFDDQARLVWKNIERQLAAAGMGLGNIVKHTTFLSSRDHRAANSRIRREILGPLTPALTVIIAEIYDDAWLLEVEAVAMA